MPNLVEVKSWQTITQEILAKYAERRRARGVEYTADLNDIQTAIAEAIAYRLYLQNVYFNQAFNTIFLDQATGEKLDYISRALFGVERITGEKPVSKVRLKLVKPHGRVNINLGFTISNASGLQAKPVAAHDLEPDLSSGEKTLDIGFRLEKFALSSDEQLNIIQTPQPDILGIDTALTQEWRGGKDEETDQALRERVRYASQIKSTAGTKESYTYYAKQADSRVKDVQITTGLSSNSDSDHWNVNIYYSTHDKDLLKTENNAITNAITSNLSTKLTAPDVKPLTDRVRVRKATLEAIDIEASLSVAGNRSRIVEQVKEQLPLIETQLVLGSGISLFSLKKLLGQPAGVTDIQLTQPAANKTAAVGKIYQLGRVTIS